MEAKTVEAEKLEGIVVNGAEIVPANPPKCGNVNQVCDPEGLFEMIEQCKICGRCV